MRPELFRLGPLTFHSYGAMLALGILAGVYVAGREARRRGIDPAIIVDFAIYGILAGLLVSRLLYVGTHLSEYLADPIRMLYIHEGGLSLHGGVIGGALVGIVYARRVRLPFWQLTDIAAPALPLATGITRIGCFLNGCCYGVPTSLPWGVYTRYAFGLRHPTQIYEAVLTGLLFWLLWRFRHRARWDGQVFLLYVAIYSAIRFGVEAFREVAMLTPWLSVAQAASLAFFTLAAGIWLWRQRRG
ncbi:MAG: prolipoprotein diacylglyceryl transferase [bacterium]|nr:prolipoprotein diacylglyceryl transferase [bacterium]